jgi:3-methyladenine DNA glycosylase AlkD
MESILNDLRRELRENMDEKIQQSSRKFFKEDIKCYGIKAQMVGVISKTYFKTIRGKTKTEIFELCNELWQSGFMEEAFIACDWSYFVHKDYAPDDFKVFEKWVGSYVSNWAMCDTLCNHTVGDFLEKYPVYMPELKKWAKSENRWMRRASAVSLIIPARHGKFLEDIIEIANILLLDKDDLVQKGYGWMLKASSQAHPNEIFDYIMTKKSTMPRTAFRYAIEKMPPELKVKAMEKI